MPHLRTAPAAACLAAAAVLLTGCSAGDDAGSRPSEQTTGATASPSTTAGMTGMDHTHSHGDPLPTDIPAAQDPRYPVGSHVRLTADHMEGMDGAEATVVGAYDTWTYAVDYTPTTGGPEVKDHRWVVQQEIRDAGSQRLADGTRVTLDADHMEGMDGAQATIVSSTDEPVYIVDYTTPDGQTVTNHRWVVQSEMESR
ncbi:YdhK family protein [Rothia sp. BD8]|uniref:YdhK family protein n=1 Tax=Rothia sp. BD8 TaxID=2953894 RepID=UPI00383F51BC